MEEHGAKLEPLTQAQLEVLEFFSDPPAVMLKRLYELPPLGASLLKAVQGCFPEHAEQAERLIHELYTRGLVTVSPVTVDVFGVDLTPPRITEEGSEALRAALR